MITDPVDIVIPVYRGVESTRACLESVLNPLDPVVGRIHLINDASPEPQVEALLRGYASHDSVQLTEHDDNQGFVRSVNEGLRLASDRDVIILNSDTIVPPRWASRLCAAAAANPKAASITPLSNNGTICSYPNFCIANSIELDALESLDGLAAVANEGVTIDIPTGVGFCMFLRRQAIREAGEFDEDAFGRGYGEENDWCMRASEKGWKHLLSADLFVFHRGGVSFGPHASKLQKNAMRIICDRYPEYENVIAEFIERDPAEPARHALDMARARAGAFLEVMEELRARGLNERRARYDLDKQRHQQVQTLDRLLSDARQHAADESRRYEEILTAVREEAAQQDHQYAEQIKDMARGYSDLADEFRDLADEFERVSKLWFVRLWRWLTGQRSGR